MRPRIFVCHLNGTRHGGRTQSDFCVGKLETATAARQRNVERFTIELVDDRSAPALHDTRYVNLCGSFFEVRFEIDRQIQCVTQLRASGCEDGEKIAQRGTGLARDDCFKRDPLSFIGALVDNDLAPPVSFFYFAWPLVECRPIQACERRFIEIALNDVADCNWGSTSWTGSRPHQSASPATCPM
jgi:hypothetical protein